jgi:hypothetical protein
MPLLLTCPSCAKRLEAPDRAAGRQVKCLGCGTVFVVVRADAVESAAKPAAVIEPSAEPPAITPEPPPVPQPAAGNSLSGSPIANTFDPSVEANSVPAPKAYSPSDLPVLIPIEPASISEPASSSADSSRASPPPARTGRQRVSITVRPTRGRGRLRFAVMVLLVCVAVGSLLTVVVLGIRSRSRPRLTEVAVGSPELSSNGKYVAGYYQGPRGMLLGVWDYETGARYAFFDAKQPDPIRFGVAPDGRQLAMISGRDKFIFFTLPSGEIEQTIRLTPWDRGIQPAPFVTYTLDGTAVMTAFEGSLLRIDRATGQETVLFTDLNTRGVRYAPAANIVAELRYNREAGREIRWIDLAGGGPGPGFPVPEMKFSEDFAFNVSSDGRTVAFGTHAAPRGAAPAAVYVYDLRSGQRKAMFVVPDDVATTAHLQQVELSPDGNWVAACGRAGITDRRPVRFLCDVRGGTIRSFGPEGEDTFGFPHMTAFAPDGGSFAYTTTTGVRVFDVTTGADR